MVAAAAAAAALALVPMVLLALVLALAPVLVLAPAPVVVPGPVLAGLVELLVLALPAPVVAAGGSQGADGAALGKRVMLDCHGWAGG